MHLVLGSSLEMSATIMGEGFEINFQLLEDVSGGSKEFAPRLCNCGACNGRGGKDGRASQGRRNGGHSDEDSWQPWLAKRG